MKPGPVRFAFAVWCFALGLLASAPARAQETTNGFAFADFLLAPLRVHLLTATNEPAAHTTLTSNDVTRILGKVNRVWAQAGITFYLESLRIEPAANPDGFSQNVKTNVDALMRLRPEASKATNVFHVYYLKQFGPNGICIRGINFVKDTASLRPVEGGLDEPLPRVTSHELGHALTLAHRQSITNLLASGMSGAWLNEAEIKQAREAAQQREWIQPAAAVLKMAEEFDRTKRVSEAKDLWRRVTHIPLNCQSTRVARQRVEGRTK
ncbi:MAG: Matrixin [Pedosphaera sp. Tous-C6FEB]|nr:MAG: Matrixin [Pedosphaera sp. Tous-C6FEB]